MKTIIEKLRKIGATLRPGATDQELTAAELKLRLKFPKDVRELYSISNGLVLESYRVEFVALDQMFTFQSDEFGYVALTEQNDSNPFCVCCGELLNGYIVRVFHDASPQLVFRTTSSFLEAFARPMRADEVEELEDLWTDFRTNDRTEEDIRAAKQLMAYAKSQKDDQFPDALRFAVFLFSSEYVKVLRELYDSTEGCCRESVVQRLKGIGNAEAVKIIGDVSGEYKSFVSQCANRLYAAGLSATIVKDSQILLEPGPVWLNMDAFFDDRKNPNIFDRVVERAKHFLNTRK